MDGAAAEVQAAGATASATPAAEQRVPAAEAGRSDFVLALRDAAGIGLAVVPIGISFGVLVTQSGLNWWWATVFATVVFAGSLEFLLLGLVVALAPLAQIAATAFLVNFRHVFYALNFPLHRVDGRVAKAYSTFAMTDEAYAISIRPVAEGWGRARLLWVQALIQLNWVTSVTVGALAGTLLPDGLHGLQFAITAFFLVLAIEAFKVRRDVPAALVAVVLALVSRWLFGDAMLVTAMTAFVLVLLARYAVTRRGGRHA